MKKARKIVRGNSETNLPLGAFVDTLVILSSDLVQVVVKVGPFMFLFVYWIQCLFHVQACHFFIAGFCTSC